MTIHRVFAANLRARCLSRGTIADFCKLAGINRQQFNRYLSGAAFPNPSTLARISTCLEINEEELFANGTSSSVRQLDDGQTGAFSRDMA